MGQVGSLLFGPTWEPSRQVRVKTGLVGGKTFTFENGRQIDAFLNIPFAKAPSGTLRFRKPLPPESWSGVRDCTKFGPRCPHEDVSIEKFTTFQTKSEDCLILNVFAPTYAGPNTPVMFFIHGGGFAMHSSAHYGDHGICRNLCLKDVIVVTVQYRLGFFGFLSTGDENCPGNMGLWDMTMALKWVNVNIEAFNGDPNNVTVFGQSAGGASTDYLSLSPHSNKYFHKMIPMSGTALNGFAMNDSSHIREKAWNYAIQQGFIPPRSASKFDQNKALVEYMQRLPASAVEIGMLGRAGVNEGGRLDLTPVYDGDFFPEPFDILRQKAPAKPLMTGITEVEGLLFTAIKPPRGSFKEEIRRQIVFDFQKRKIHDPAREKMIFDMYLNEVEKNNRDQYVTACMTLVSDMIIANGVWELADTTVRLNKGAPTYLYSFDYHNPDGFGLAGLIFPFKAATHCSELPYLFGKGIIALFRPSEADNKMVDFFTTLFTNFAKFGDPNGKGNPQKRWEPLSLDDPNRFYHIDVEDSEMRTGFCGGRPQKWRQFLKPCDCGQRVCSKENLKGMDDNNNDLKKLDKTLASDEVTQFTLIEEYAE